MAQSPSPQTPQAPPTTPQTTRPSADTQQRQDSLKNMIGQTVTVSGCLARDTATGQTTTTAPAGAGSDFVLTNVQVRSGAPTPGATPGAPSTTAPATPGIAGAAGAMKIKLKAMGDAKLGENVNKQVEVTGRLEAGSATPSATGTPGTPETGAPRPTGSATPTPEMQVSTVRVLEQTCTPGK